jgi:hypothetical protein
VTATSRAPDEPGPRRQADGPRVPDPQPGDRDPHEMQDPYDLPFPDLSERWPSSRPMYVIVVDQLRDWRPGQPPSLAELLEAGAARTHEPEPDLEAEP